MYIGGFAVTDPQVDAPWCNYLSNEHSICVVSIDYRKAPKFRFPQQIYDVAKIIEQVINDPDLPIDKSKVIVGGFSA